jgi:hypothetical protein
MLTEARDWWEKHAAQYQRQSQIPLFVDSKTLALHRSYFDTGRHAEGPGPGDVFASMHRTVAEYFNAQVAVGFVVEQVVEPDSRTRYPEDPWYGLWDCTPALLEKIPGTIVFRARKQKA